MNGRSYFRIIIMDDTGLCETLDSEAINGNQTQVRSNHLNAACEVSIRHFNDGSRRSVCGFQREGFVDLNPCLLSTGIRLEVSARTDFDYIARAGGVDRRLDFVEPGVLRRVMHRRCCCQTGFSQTPGQIIYIAAHFSCCRAGCAAPPVHFSGDAGKFSRCTQIEFCIAKELVMQNRSWR